MDRMTRGKEWFCCSSPGDGALYFGWVDTKTGNSTSREVTVADVEEWFRHEEGEYFVSRGYSLHRINGDLRLVAPIVRLGKQYLWMNRYDGQRVYRYSIDPSHSETPTARLYTFLTVLHGEHHVKHISTISAIAFFLENEENLKKTPLAGGIDDPRCLLSPI